MSIYKEITGHGEDVVLLHGWGADHRFMKIIADLLAPRYRVINIDLPGRGRSAWQASIHDMHSMVDAILPDLPERAIYIGWSFGGAVTTSIAARYPMRVKHFIGISTTPRFVEDQDWPAIPKPGFSPAFATLPEVGYQAFFQSWCDSEFAAFDPKPKAYHQLVQLLAESPENNIEVILKGVDICDQTDLRKEFKSLTCPIDLIMGGKDGAVPAACYDAIKKLNPRTVLHVIPDAHHLPLWTHPEEFNRILKNIL